MTATPSIWTDACLAATIMAVSPGETGAVVRAPCGVVRDDWVSRLSDPLPSGAPMRKIPAHVQDSRLLGGLDLAATLSLGRKTIQRGILAEADGGCVILPMAERLSLETAGRLCQVLDSGEVLLERDGLALRHPTRFGLLALDEGIEADERPPASVCDRVAFWIDLTTLSPRDLIEADWTGDVEAARARLPSVEVPDDILGGICQAAAVLGIESVRAVLFALTTARVIAALDDRTIVSVEDATTAGRLVLAPRATVVPAPPEAPPEPPPPEPGEDPPPDQEQSGQVQELAEMVLAACQASLPPDLLAGLRPTGAPKRAEAGRSGQRQRGMLRGRPAGVRMGDPRSGGRLHVLETLRNAAPRQKLRPPAPHGIAVRKEDFRIVRTRPRTQTTTIFLVDASGSTALHRLGEAKGAVELLLDQCYVRRDQVALLAFRGKVAELLLPPTGALVRAKRCLAALPGGGGTPLATGLDAARLLADGIRRRGRVPTIIVMTDGKANVGRDGEPGRARAEADALAAARLIRASGVASLLVDTSLRPAAAARALAQEMGARCLALPYADSATLSRAARNAGAA